MLTHHRRRLALTLTAEDFTDAAAAAGVAHLIYISFYGAAPNATRTISYYPETIDEAYPSRTSYGAPNWQLDAWVSTYTAIADGSLAGVTTAIDELTVDRGCPESRGTSVAAQ